MRNWRLWIYALIAVGLLLFPSMPFGTNDNLNLLISLFTVASMASSWNILAGFVGRVNLGHVAFFGLGALVARELWLGETPLPLALAAGGVAAALGAVIVGAPALRLKGIYFAVGTLAFAEALRLTVSTTMPRISRLPGPLLRTYEIEPRYYLTLAILILIVITVYWLSRSKIGLGMMAIREDEEAARSIGINVFLHSMLAFVLSAFFAGLTGGAFAYFHVSYYPSFVFTPIWTFDAVLVTFIGGIGTLAGPLVGSVFFVFIRDILAKNLLHVHLIIFGIIFIFVVLALPNGIIDLWSRYRKWIVRWAPLKE
jgi:branched-chain amino acid transport system permease protein